MQVDSLSSACAHGADSEGLAASGRSADSSPDGIPENQKEQPQAQEQQQSPLKGTSAEGGSGGSERRGDESSGSSDGGRPVSASSAQPAVGSPHQEADSGPHILDKAESRHQTQHQSQQLSVHRAQSVQLTSTPLGGVAVQQQGGCPALMGGAGHGHGPTDDSDAIVDTTPDQLSSTPIHSSASSSMQKQYQLVVDLTSSIDPSPLASAAASAGRQPAGPSRPFPPPTPSPVTPHQQHMANTRKGQTSGSAAIMSLAADALSLGADALLAGDSDPFASHVETLRELPRLRDDDPSVKQVVGLLAKKDEAHRQQGLGGLAGCIVGLVNDSSSDIEHQNAATCFLRQLCQARYPFGVEWLPLFGVLVDTVLGRLTLPDDLFIAAMQVVQVVSCGRMQGFAEALGAFRQHLFCHIDVLVETQANSSDQATVWRAYGLIGLIFSHARRFISDPGVLASMCCSVAASPLALGKTATSLKNHAASQWPVCIVWDCLSVIVAMAESGYCERLVHAGFLSATLSIMDTNEVAMSIGLIRLIVDRQTYASCEGLAELMVCQLSSAVTQDTAFLASIPRGDNDNFVSPAMSVLNSPSGCWDRQLMSGKSKDNPIVERVLQVDTSALSGTLMAASQDSLLQEILDFFAAFHGRKVAIDRWVSSQQDPQREAARQQNKQNPMVRCLSDRRVLHTIYELGGPLSFSGPLYFTAAQVAMLAVSCRSLLDVLCPVRATERISAYVNHELLAPDASISVSNQNRLAAALARYSPRMMLTLSIRWECSPTADDVSDLIAFLDRADKLFRLKLMYVDLRQMPDDECIRLANAIGRLPSLAILYLKSGSLGCAFIDVLSALLKAQPEGDGKGESNSSESASPPPSSSRDVTRIPSTSSAAVPGGSKEDGQETTEAGPAGDRQDTTEAGQEIDTGDDKKERPFTTLRCMTVASCHMSFNSYLNLLKGLCGRSFQYLTLVDIVLTETDNEADRCDQLQRVLERLFGTITCTGLHLSFGLVGELSLPIVEGTVISATIGLKANPNRRTLRRLYLPATATTIEPFLQFALKDLTLSSLSLSSSEPLGKLVGGQFLASGDFASLVREAVGRAHAARESELADARAVKERQWAADDARLPPATDAAEEDRWRVAREWREERLRAKEKEIRSKPFLDLTHIPLPETHLYDSIHLYVLPVIEDMNRQNSFGHPVIDTCLGSVDLQTYVPSSRLPSHLCRVLVRSYDPMSPLTWWHTVARKAPSLMVLYSNSLFSNNRGFQNSFSVTAADLATYRDCLKHLEALKDDPAINNITQEDVDAARTALTEATRLVYQALHGKCKRLEVIENLLATLQTELDGLKGQRAKAAASKADKGDRQHRRQDRQHLHQKMVTGEELLVDGQHKSRCDVVREELREKLESRKNLKAKQERRMKRQADKTTDEAVSSAMAAREATARRNEKNLLRSIGEQVSDDSEDRQQHGGGGQQGGEGGKKAKKKKRHKKKKPSAAPGASAGPLPLAAAAAAASLAVDSSPSVREGEGERVNGLELADEPSSSPLHGPSVAADGSAAAMSSASGPPQAPMAPFMPLLPGGGRESDDLLSVDGASGHGGGGDERLTGQGAEESDGGAAGGDDGRVSGGEETVAMRARFAAELAGRDQQIEALQRELMRRDMAAQQQVDAAQQETLAERQEIERLRKAQLAGEQTVADTLANERLQADMKKANEVYRQQLSQQYQRLTSAVDREKAARQQQVTEMQRHIEQAKRAAAQRETSLRQENTSLRQESASQGQEIASLQASVGSLQADIEKLRGKHIDQLTDLRQQMQQQMQQSNQRAREEATDCQVCQARERSVVLRPCNHFIICRQCAQTMQPRQCPVCRQVFTGWTPAIFS
ncbi:unnamed protein product [Vitrella brassicaformis CCMP3155]|uniref:RING-type domain-containing protein n=3 Tax=Vitrella brassicaformis TaxID=1169539 RepID=A0A0G4G885_VITBC|nr:unnamed protein product [Vitrella brassicaformis CCMP3155]|eukprot:CEM24736.1 unnamed protein product [Vitrella brassicaformis CCMP3155]